ncbi:MAG: DUF4282 domain-containing protein [Pseudomonadota bacterium]|jgi:hypothetical protein|nr:MAG: hypothetical protein DIU62_02890 [Pseudomonadota bacterium]
MTVRDIFFFDNMVTPKVITFVYWLMLLGSVIAGIGVWRTLGSFTLGLMVLVGGAIGARIWCELLIVLFKMNEALQDLRRR